MDPVVNGRNYVSDYVAAQSEIERWFLTPKPLPPPNGDLNLLGFPLTTSMRLSIEAIESSHFAQPTGARVTLFYSEPPAEVERLHQALEASGTTFRAETVPGQPPWRESKAIVNGGPPFAIVERMVETLR